jgi:hypothetical protein
MRRVLCFLSLIVVIDAFFNMNSFFIKPRLPKTSLNSQYLNQLSNHSYKEQPKLLPKPVMKKDPIPFMNFDQMFLVFFSTNRLYMSSNADRIIVCYDDKKGVYYMNNKKEKDKIEFLLSLIDLDVEIVNDYPTIMDRPSGSLYCSPKQPNMTEDEIENILHSIIYDDDEEDDDYEFDFY